MIEISSIEVRQHNGQNAYGPWINASDETRVPAWVGEYAADEMAETQKDEGRVEKGGNIWLFRRA